MECVFLGAEASLKLPLELNLHFSRGVCRTYWLIVRPHTGSFKRPGVSLATSVTGFCFTFDHLLPSHDVGIISLAVLAVVIQLGWMFVGRLPLVH
ncbi:MAG TPA: hypothetical protein VKM54_17710 [Myxococcota bacterium]|nr:hypothetical protein [Myxococcota bacterium]